MIPEEILMDFMYELNDFRSKRDNYNLEKCAFIFTLEFFRAIEKRANISIEDDRLAKALLNQDAAIQAGTFEDVRLFIGLNDLGGNDFMVVRTGKNENEGLTYGEMLPQYVTEMI